MPITAHYFVWSLCPHASVPNNIFTESDLCPGRFCPTLYPFSFQVFHSHCWHYTWLTQAWKLFLEWIFTFFPHQWKMSSVVRSEWSRHAGGFAGWILTGMFLEKDGHVVSNAVIEICSEQFPGKGYEHFYEACSLALEKEIRRTAAA